MLPEPVDLAMDAGALAGVNVLLWLLSLPLGKVWPVDFIWSGWPPVQCVLILARAWPAWPSDGVRRLLACTLVAVWGWRLTFNFVSRGGVGHEDWRYADMRRQMGKHFWWASLFSVFLGQTIFMFGPCLALYGALLGARPVDGCDAAAAVVCACAILLEATADMQMDSFQAAKREKRTDATIMETGLWGWSRHPNYLGESAPESGLDPPRRPAAAPHRPARRELTLDMPPPRARSLMVVGLVALWRARGRGVGGRGAAAHHGAVPGSIGQAARGPAAPEQGRRVPRVQAARAVGAPPCAAAPGPLARAAPLQRTQGAVLASIQRGSRRLSIARVLLSRCMVAYLS